MKWTSWAFLAFLGSLAFFVLFIADQQMNAGVDRLSTMKLPSRSALDGDRDLKLVSERSPNMRTER
jgi:predicted proteasome-type protease